MRLKWAAVEALAKSPAGLLTTIYAPESDVGLSGVFYRLKEQGGRYN